MPLTKAAWPLAWVRMTGLLGETLSSESWRGKPSTFGVGRLGPLGLVPAAADDPLAGLGLLDGAADLGHDVVPGAGFAQIEAHAEFADAGEVSVAFDEAGNGEHAVEIDDLGVGADPLGGGAVCAERGDFAGADGDRLRGRRAGAHGDDLAVAQDEVGGLGLKGSCKGGDDDGKECAHGVQDTEFWAGQA